MPRPIILHMQQPQDGDGSQLSFAGRIAAQRLARASSRRQPDANERTDKDAKGGTPPRAQGTPRPESSRAPAVSQPDHKRVEAPPPLARSPPPRQAVDAEVTRLLAQHSVLAEAAPLAEPPVSGDESLSCTWHEYGGAQLEPLLAFTTLVDARWLLAFAKSGPCADALEGGLPIVPAWHQLPAEAEVCVDDLRRSTWHGGLPVGALSYCWASHAHPDPTGETLQALRPLLEAICKHCDELEEATGLHMSFGVFWDFLSLPMPWELWCF